MTEDIKSDSTSAVPSGASTARTETRITGQKLTDMLLYTGEQFALQSLQKELAAAQKQHPSAVGLTLAIAFVERDKAKAELKSSRLVFAEAAKAGLIFDGQLLTSKLEGDCIVVRVETEAA